MGPKGTINYDPKVSWLKGQAANVYTQFGEDGLIAATLEKIGESNRQCFEIGAHDGIFFSNTLRLREAGWKAVLLESDDVAFERLNTQFGHESICLHGHFDDLDEALSRTNISKTPDLGIIDIDGQDYWMWADLLDYRPRILLVEIFPPDAKAAIPYRGCGPEAQAGLNAIVELGANKGYELVATTYCNALFVDSDAWKI